MALTREKNLFSLISQKEEEEDYKKSFIPSTQDAKPVASGSECSTADGSQRPTTIMDLHNICKRAAEKLGILDSCYKGKWLPKCSARQRLPVFLECLEEATRLWNNSFSAKKPCPGKVSD